MPKLLSLCPKCCIPRSENLMRSTWSHIPLPRPIKVLSYRHALWWLPLGDGASILEKEDLNLRNPPPQLVFAVPRSHGSNSQLLPLPTAMPSAITLLYGCWFLPLWLECNSPLRVVCWNLSSDLCSRAYPLYDSGST